MKILSKILALFSAFLSFCFLIFPVFVILNEPSIIKIILLSLATLLLALLAFRSCKWLWKGFDSITNNNIALSEVITLAAFVLPLPIAVRFERAMEQPYKLIFQLADVALLISIFLLIRFKKVSFPIAPTEDVARNSHDSDRIVGKCIECGKSLDHSGRNDLNFCNNLCRVIYEKKHLGAHGKNR